jgi:hypothetical protein
VFVALFYGPGCVTLRPQEIPECHNFTIFCVSAPLVAAQKTVPVNKGRPEKSDLQLLGCHLFVFGGVVVLGERGFIEVQYFLKLLNDVNNWHVICYVRGIDEIG